MKLTARQIERLVKRGEVVHAECKDASGGLPDSLWESYSSFANPGIFRVNKAVAVEGGTSDARNSHIFNIFALVDIGERSGMGLAYWLIGRRIVVEEQKGCKRATYGEHLLERISRELGAEFGNGFGEPHLRNCRLFYKAYPTEAEIRYALRIKLTWTHHRAIMRVQEPKARAYYLREAEEQGWDTRELERQIRMFAYERVVARKGGWK